MAAITDGKFSDQEALLRLDIFLFYEALRVFDKNSKAKAKAAQ